MLRELQDIREALDKITAEAGQYAGCRCSIDDCAPGDCWPCRMISLAERGQSGLAKLDGVIERLQSPELEKVISYAIMHKIDRYETHIQGTAKAEDAADIAAQAALDVILEREGK